MAPSASAAPPKAKRPVPPGIQTNGINSSTSSPSPSISASRLPGPGAKILPGSATSNGVGGSSSGVRSANRTRREAPSQLLGRGQRNSSVGLRSASLAGETLAPQIASPQPYVRSDAYILKKYRGNPPSLIVHLHAAHFRFDQQEGNFSYKSPMRLLIEHLRLRTIPHDLAEFFAASNVPYYEGCMIVQIHDHKSTAPSQESNRAKTGAEKSTPFSMHNSNAYLTPSPYVPYPNENQIGKRKNSSDGDNDESGKSKTSEQKDKENMPAPNFPVDGQRAKSSAQPKKPKILTIVLHPTPISNHADIAIKAADARSANQDVRESRHDSNAGPLSATVPPTPSTAIPQTPLTNMAPPAKRLKKTRLELDSSNFHAAESQITLATTAPLILEPVGSALEAAALLDHLAHPMHVEKPPSPKTRKRTVAELAADEAAAAEQERYMTILDERLSSNVSGVQGGANPADGDGQAGGASFEPRFERFKTLENIKAQLEENKKAEKVRQQEAERKSQQDRERERLRLEAEKRDREKMNQQQMAQQAAANQQNEARRRAAMANGSQLQQPQGMQGGQSQSQSQVQHAHPQANGVMSNGLQAQARFHQQQASQAQISSPIVRNTTPQIPQNHSSPMGNIPMQQSTSSMGGSPPRPGSVVNQNHPQMGGPGMTTQRSQQSHAGTPRMHNVTPNVQSTPINRPMSQTPRMSQASPLQGPMAQVPPNMMAGVPNGQMMVSAEQQQRMLQQRMMQQRVLAAQNQQNAMQMNGQQPISQQQFIQAQMMRAQQQGNPMQNTNQLAQSYAAQLASLGQRPGGMPANMNMNINNNSPGGPGMNMNQIHAFQQMQQMQAQQHQAAQAQAHLAQQQAHAQAQAAQNNPQAAMRQQMMQAVRQQTQLLFNQQMAQLSSQYPNGLVPEDVAQNLRRQCNQTAQANVQNQWNARQRQAAMMAQQGGGMQPNGMQNGMGMQRPPGM